MLDGKELKDLVIDADKKGNPKRDKEGVPLLKLGPSMTLRNICTDVLVNPPSQIDPLTRRAKEIPADQKLKMWDLAQRIHSCNGSIALGSKEQELLKELINRRYPSGVSSTLIVAQSFALLDPAEEEEKDPPKK